MRQDAAQYVTITSISAPPNQPQIQDLDVVQTYITATQTATYSKTGSPSAQAIISYFLLEGGIWHVWFST